MPVASRLQGAWGFQMVAVEAGGTRVGYAPSATRVPWPQAATWAAGTSWLWARLSIVELAALAALAGGALLVTLVLLGRPPLSMPTLAGIRTFTGVTALVLLASTLETLALSALTRRPPRSVRHLSLAGWLPLGFGWALSALLFRPDVHHWFVSVESVRPAMLTAVLLPTAALKIGLFAIAAREPLQAWCWRWRYALAGFVYAAAALCAKPSLWHIDLPGWFVPAAELALRGQILEIYSVRTDVMQTASPLEHGPLSIVLYAPFVALGQLVGKADFLRVGAVFPLAGVLLFDCLMAFAATRAVKDLVPRIEAERLFGIYALILFSPLLWFSSVWLVHLESLSALLVICAVRLLSRERGAAGGACLGAALLLKHSAALAVGPLLLAFFIGGRYALALRAGAVAAGVMVAGLAPFAIATPEHFAYNFFGYDSIKPIYGLTLWKATYDSGIEPLIMRLDSLLVAVVALGSAAGVSLYLRRRPGHDVRVAAWIAILLGQLAWLGLATWQYPHYFVLAFVVLLIWETATRPGWPIAALLFLFVPYNLQSHFPSNVGKAGGAFVVARAAAQALFLYGCAVAVWMRAATSYVPPLTHVPRRI